MPSAFFPLRSMCAGEPGRFALRPEPYPCLLALSQKGSWSFPPSFIDLPSGRHNDDEVDGQVDLTMFRNSRSIQRRFYKSTKPVVASHLGEAVSPDTTTRSAWRTSLPSFGLCARRSINAHARRESGKLKAAGSRSAKHALEKVGALPGRAAVGDSA